MIPMQGGVPMGAGGMMPGAGMPTAGGQPGMMDKFAMLDPQKRKLAMALMGNLAQGASGQAASPQQMLQQLAMSGMGRPG